MVRETLIHGFFGKRQYAAIALKRLTIKVSKVLCLEQKVTVREARESNVPPMLCS